MQILFDFAGRSRSAAARVLTELAPGSPLPQQVPALVQLLLSGTELLVLLVAGQLTGCQPGTQVVLGLDEIVDGAENFLVVHSLVLPRGFAHLSILPVEHRCGVLPTRYVRAMQLSRKRIVGAAIKLIEADGVEAASMPRLATELGCSLIALYNHVPSTNALLDGIADEVMSGIAWTPAPGARSPDQVKALVRAMRQMARAHPRCAVLALSRRGFPAGLLRPAEAALAALQDEGFSGPDAVRMLRALAAYILGSLLLEVGIAPGLTDGGDGQSGVPRLRPSEFPQLADLYPELRASDPDGDFEFGLDLLVRPVTASPLPEC